MNLKELNELAKKFEIQNFINLIKNDLSKYRGKLILKKSILKNRSFDGEFSEDGMIIKCFVDYSSTYWIGVLAHEYCHFLQCVNGNKFWDDFQEKLSENIEDLELIFQGGNTKLSKRLRKKIATSIIQMELDCDKSAIKLINKYKLPVDKKEYSSKANIILYKYLYWGEYGTWPDLVDKKNGKCADWKSLKVSKLMDQELYSGVKNIPKNLFSIFKDN